MQPNPKGGFHYICDLPAGSHKQVDEKTHFILPSQTHSQRMTANRSLARRSHYVHNFPLALPYISCSQIFFRLDCLYSLYDILVFF